MKVEEAAAGWVAVPGPLPEPGHTLAFEAGGLKLLLCNAGGEYFAIENRCPHARVGLDDGALRGAVLECAVHGGQIDVRDGRPLRPPIRRSVCTYPLRPGSHGLEVGMPGLR